MSYSSNSCSKAVSLEARYSQARYSMIMNSHVSPHGHHLQTLLPQCEGGPPLDAADTDTHYTKNNKESFLLWPRVLSCFPCEYNVLYCHSDIVILCLTRPAITGNGNLLRYGQLPNNIFPLHGLPCGYYDVA